jgi:hypothetical protein
MVGVAREFHHHAGDCAGVVAESKALSCIFRPIRRLILSGGFVLPQMRDSSPAAQNDNFKKRSLGRVECALSRLAIGSRYSCAE